MWPYPKAPAASLLKTTPVATWGRQDVGGATGVSGLTDGLLL